VELSEYLRRLPKVELHCHVHGTLRPSTVIELARKHDVPLPTTDVDELYRYDNIDDFLAVVDLCCTVVRDRDDFARIAYESLEDGHRAGNLRYQEMFLSPMTHLELAGASFATQIDGLVDGMRAAEADLGVRSAIICNINRSRGASAGLEMVERLLEHRRPEVIGIGLDYAEAGNPPEQFVDAYRLAARNGLHLTAHACEDAPAENVVTCLDLLGCERIDHGYWVIWDDDVLRRCRDEGVHFDTTLSSTAQVYGWRDLAQHPIVTMVGEGLRVNLSTDDPTMFQTDLGQEFVKLFAAGGFGPDVARRLVLDGVDATWLDEVDRSALRRRFEAEIDTLDAALDETHAG
jgi:adenosine deaminase